MNNSDKTICNYLIDRVRKTPSANAIGSISKNKIKFINFKKYGDTIERLSCALINLGVIPQNKVAILSLTRKEWNYIDLAIMSAGAVSVPVYPSYLAGEVEYIINHSEAEFLIIEDQTQFEKILEIQHSLPKLKNIISIEDIKTESLKELKDTIKLTSWEDCINLGIELVQKNPDQFINNSQKLSPDSLATIVYTSGTTGEPKGALISHRALYQVLVNVKKYSQNAIGGDDRFMTFLPLSHVLGRLESFFTILFGAETVYAPDMKKIIENISIVQPTILVVVPRVLEKVYEKAIGSFQNSEVKKVIFEGAMKIANNYFDVIANNKSPKPGSILQFHIVKKLVFDKVYQMFGGRIRYFLSGGAPLSPEIIKFMRNANLTVLEGYGLTETVAPCFVNSMTKQVPGTVGQPLGDVEVKFLDDGEILLKSLAMFSGYYKNEEATAESLDQDGWLHTGDIGEFDSEGYLKITGRKKDIIITSGGKNIAPQKIESLLQLSPYIAHSVIIGDNQKYLTALIAIEREAFIEHFEEYEINEDCDFRHLANHELINELIKQEISIYNGELASFETIKNFKIIPVEIDGDNYLTPSLKIKKLLVKKDYENLIGAMYKDFDK